MSSDREPTGAAQALRGIRVVEFTAGMAGPWIGRIMACCGAEVIKIESHRHPTVVRLYVPPRAPELGIQPALSPWLTDWDAGKRFVALDLSRPDAVELARRIVSICDVVIENYSSGVMEKLGLGYEELARVRPDLIYFSSSGYGDTGPCRRYVTWGPNIEALSGLATLSGFPERECTLTQFAYPDGLSALHGLFAVLCALDHRARTGEGQRITLSQLEATIGALGPLMMEQLAQGREPRRLGNASLHAAPQGCYPCRGEDRWCAITVASDTEWERLCDVAAAARVERGPALRDARGAPRARAPSSTPRSRRGPARAHALRGDGHTPACGHRGRRGADGRGRAASRSPARGARLLRRGRAPREGPRRRRRHPARTHGHAEPDADGPVRASGRTTTTSSASCSA